MRRMEPEPGTCTFSMHQGACIEKCNCGIVSIFVKVVLRYTCVYQLHHTCTLSLFHSCPFSYLVVFERIDICLGRYLTHRLFILPSLSFTVSSFNSLVNIIHSSFSLSFPSLQRTRSKRKFLTARTAAECEEWYLALREILKQKQSKTCVSSLLEGYLEKEGGAFGGKWQSRWCIVMEDRIDYFKNR